MTDDHRLSFEIMHTESKDIFFGGSHNSVPDTMYPVKLYVDGKPNMHNVSAVCALKGYIPTADEYRSIAAERISPMSNEIYRYLNFDQIKGFEKEGQIIDEAEKVNLITKSQ